MRVSKPGVLLFALLVTLGVPSSAQIATEAGRGSGPATDAMRAVMRGDQTLLADQLDGLSKADLRAVVDGANPSRLKLRESSSTPSDDWRIMTKAYAKAALDDRERTASRWRDLLFGMGIGAVLVMLGSVAETKVSGKSKRQKRRASKREEVQSSSPSALLRRPDPHQH